MVYKFFDKNFADGTVKKKYLADMQLISKFNKGFRISLSVIDVYSKYTWVIPLKRNHNY